MTNKEAYQRAKRALLMTDEETDSFDHGGFASGEIIDAVDARLRRVFRQPPRATRQL